MKCKKCNEESGKHDLCKKCYASNQKMTEGEEVIKDFLEEKDIKYEFQKEVPNLINDEKEFRLADFYLPKYKIYLEFLGNWNNLEKREQYNFKKIVYNKNNLPCVYLYPENLGILDRILKRRIKKVLQNHSELKWSLLRLNWDIFLEKVGLTAIVLVLLAIYVPEMLWKIAFSLAFLAVVYSGLKDSFFRKIE